jgi:nickel-dependent lactate racemase
MNFVSFGGPNLEISRERLEDFVAQTVKSISKTKNALVIPPDITRFHSMAGTITDMLFANLGARLGAVMPALGTHVPMSYEEIERMYPGTPKNLFRIHDWRGGLAELGTIDGDFMKEVSEGKLEYEFPVQANRLLIEGGFDTIFSVGQVVPHEVIGMANHAKNIFVGTGGKSAIDRSHYLGAVYGLERIMGRMDTPVRKVLDKALDITRPKLPPIVWMLTVIGRNCSGRLVLRGFFSGDDRSCFEKACALASEVNIEKLDREILKAVVWLDPSEYRSTWLGNKAVYRTRMAMADEGELVVLAPGLAQFGEDSGIDAMIRKYGYRKSAEIQELVKKNPDLADNLSAAAHLIHGSSEGRFKIRYVPGNGVEKTEIESVGYEWGNFDEFSSRYDVSKLSAGWNRMADGEEIYFVPNPAVGLWASRSRFG